MATPHIIHAIMHAHNAMLSCTVSDVCFQLCPAECMATPHIIHAIMSVIASAIFASITFLLVMADHDLNPMSKSMLSSPHSLTELKVCVCVCVCVQSPLYGPHKP